MFKVYHKYLHDTFTVYDVILRDNTPFFLIYDNINGWAYHSSDKFEEVE